MWFSHLDKSLTHVCMSNHQCTRGFWEDGCCPPNLMLLCTPENVKMLHTWKSLFFFFMFLAFWPLLWYRTVKYRQEVKWTGSGKVSESGLKLRKPETQLRYMLTCCPRGYCRRLFMFSFLNIFGWGWTLKMQMRKFVHVYLCYGYAFLQMHFAYPTIFFM